MLLVARYALGIGEDSLIAETAKVFGLNNSEDVKQTFAEVLERLVRDRKLIAKGDVITAA